MNATIRRVDLLGIACGLFLIAISLLIIGSMVGAIEKNKTKSGTQIYAATLALNSCLNREIFKELKVNAKFDFEPGASTRNGVITGPYLLVSCPQQHNDFLFSCYRSGQPQEFCDQLALSAPHYVFTHFKLGDVQ